MNVLEMAAYIARTTYTSEFCSICGRVITIEDAKTTVIADNRENRVQRSAHKDCSLTPKSEKTWTYPIDKV